MDEIQRIKEKAYMAERKFRLDKAMMEFGEHKPELIIWENMSDDNIDAHIKMALEHECFRYVKLLKEKKEERRKNKIRKFIKGGRKH